MNIIDYFVWYEANFVQLKMHSHSLANEIQPQLLMKNIYTFKYDYKNYCYIPFERENLAH
jgi:hypothetical protein